MYDYQAPYANSERGARTATRVHDSTPVRRRSLSSGQGLASRVAAEAAVQEEAEPLSPELGPIANGPSNPASHSARAPLEGANNAEALVDGPNEDDRGIDPLNHDYRVDRYNSFASQPRYPGYRTRQTFSRREDPPPYSEYSGLVVRQMQAAVI